MLLPTLSARNMTLPADRYQAAYDEWKDRLTIDNKGVHALARIPDFQALIHTATVSALPIYRLDEQALKNDGIQGIVKEDSMKNVVSFNAIYEAIASKITTLLT